MIRLLLLADTREQSTDHDQAAPLDADTRNRVLTMIRLLLLADTREQSTDHDQAAPLDRYKRTEY